MRHGVFVNRYPGPGRSPPIGRRQLVDPREGILGQRELRLLSAQAPVRTYRLDAPATQCATPNHLKQGQRLLAFAWRRHAIPHVAYPGCCRRGRRGFRRLGHPPGRWCWRGRWTERQSGRRAWPEWFQRPGGRGCRGRFCWSNRLIGRRTYRRGADCRGPGRAGLDGPGRRRHRAVDRGPTRGRLSGNRLNGLNGLNGLSGSRFGYESRSAIWFRRRTDARSGRTRRCGFDGRS